MKLLFFDMEFANGQVPGSIYSFGYLMTDENFDTVLPQTDLLIDPDSTWNEYVKSNILAYPCEEVEASPRFPTLYGQIKELFASADMAVGFAVNNDTRALRQDCERYGLDPLEFRVLDMEKLCKKMEDHREAHGLGGYVRAWCGEEPDHRHRSDGDAYATMMLLRAVCASKHATPDMIIEAYPECIFRSTDPVKKAKPVAHKSVHRCRRRKKKAKEA